MIDVDPEPPPKKQYAQNWPAYDKAKTNEDAYIKELLTEILLFYDFEICSFS